MKLKEIIDQIGKPEKSDDVIQLLSNIGVKQPLKRPTRSEPDVHAKAKNPPIELLFSAEREWAKNYPVTKGEMILHTVFLEPEVFANDESLFPFKLNATSTRAQIREKLGTPSWTSPAFNNDRWIVHGLRVVFDFSDDERSINAITFSINPD